MYIDEVGSESKFILPPSRHLGKTSHRMLFASTRVCGPTKTVIFSEMPPDRLGSASINKSHRKGVQEQRLDSENAVAQERSQATAKARSKTQASLTMSSTVDNQHLRNLSPKRSPKQNQKNESDAEFALKSITLGLHCVSISIISDHAQELLLASISKLPDQYYFFLWSECENIDPVISIEHIKISLHSIGTSLEFLLMNLKNPTICMEFVFFQIP